MAKLSSVVKNNKRKALASKYWKYRKELREKAVNAKLSDQERSEAQLKLMKLRRDTSPCRSITRCELSGRARGNYKKFGLSRIAFRQLALDGKLPGVTKASW